MTVVIPAYNEADVIAQKIDDTLAQDYPPERFSIFVVDDGSTDATASIARDKGVSVFGGTDRAGKWDAINRAMSFASSTVVCLTDANGSLAPGSLRAVGTAFAADDVAVVSGTKHAVGAGGAYGAGESAYWRLENGLKEAESSFGCAMGADGGIYAVRRAHFRPIPPCTIADDLEVPFAALERGLKVVHVSAAAAYEEVSQSTADEFERRTRVAAGVWQAIVRHCRLADPRRGPVAIAFVSHRVLRTVVVPFALVVAWIGCAALAPQSRLARIAFALQSAGWGGAAIGTVVESKVFGIPLQFALANLASIRGGCRYMTGQQPTSWRRTQRGRWIAARRTRAA
jgi:cellulose synthase/poly-beta-1,6-N-acetylglucosamine synthase-like glycosyltransferase